MRFLSLKDEAILYLTGSVLILALEFGTWNNIEPVSALDNGVRITNNYTGALTNWPIYFGRWFARGEITGYPRPYATPSNTGTRAALGTWQSEVKERWRDATAERTITSARIGSPTWTTGGGGLTNVVRSTSGVTTGNWSPTAHGLALGDRLVICCAPSTVSQIDNAIVHAVPSATSAQWLDRGLTSGGSYPSNSTTYTSGVTISQKLDPMEPTFVCRYYSANHGFLKGETVTIAGMGNGMSASCNGTLIVTGTSQNEFVGNLRDATGLSPTVATAQSGATATGPDYGSVRFALVAFQATVPASGNTYVDFVNSTNPSSAGDAAATVAAGMSKAAMLADTTWNMDFTATADVAPGSTAAATTSARTILTGWDGTESYCGPRYWTKGPVMTWIILENGCQNAPNRYTTNDFGWKIRAPTTLLAAITASQPQIHVASRASMEVNTRIYAWTSNYVFEVMLVTAITDDTTTCNGVSGLPVGDCLTVTRGIQSSSARTQAAGRTIGIWQWEDAPSQWYKGGHSEMSLKFFAGGSVGVGERVAVHNEYDWKISNMFYGITIKTGSTPTVRKSFNEIKHQIGTSWKWDTYDGTDAEFYNTAGGDPDSGTGTRKRRYLINHNTAYMVYAKALPAYKLYSGLTMAPFDGYFAGSGKGAVNPTNIVGGHLDAGTFNRPDNSAATSPEYNHANATEAYVLPYTQALCLHTWSEGCYEINFGDSVPGGAGNVESQRHVAHWGYIEDDDSTYTTALGGATVARPFVPGYSGSAYGRRISMYARPTWIAYLTSSFSSLTTAWDKPRTPCTSGTVPAIPVSGSVSSTSGAGYLGQPCWVTNSVGYDGWEDGGSPGMDHTHVNDWNEFAYLISADPRHLDAVQAMASWYSGWENSCRFIGKAWVIPEGCGATPSAVRAQGGATRATLAAATHSVNQPQFGNAGPSVESIYYHEKLWDVALTKEATFQITNGWFFQMYPPASYGNAWDTTCTVKPWSSLWHYVRCNVLGDMQNPLAWFGLASNNGNDCTGMGQPNAEPWVDCPAGYAAVGMWYYHHGVVQWSRAESWGMPMFYYVRRAWGNTALSLWGSSHWNPYLNDLYHAPSRGPGTNRPWVQTLTALFNGMKTTWSGGFTRDDQTWFHDNARFGFALASDGYIPQWRADLAVNSDMSPGTRDGCAVTAKTPNGCSWEYAWNWINSHLPKQNLWGSNPKYIIDPYPTIANLTCTPGGTSAVCTYTAPTNDICTYVAGTSAPADTLDANTGTGVLTDTSDGGGGRFRKIVIGSLTEATAYNLRITCGPRVTGISTGTGRTSTTFTTLTEGAGTTHVMKLGPMTGATTATVAYGDTSAVSGGTVGPTACTSGCSLTIPATSKKLLYVRITRKNASAVTLVQTAAQAVMVP